MRVRFASLFLAAAVPIFGAAPEEEFDKEIKPILKNHCYECHNEQKTRGDVNLEQFGDLDRVKEEPQLWRTVLEQIQAFEMPPSGKNELDFNKHQRMLRWLRGLPKPEQVDCNQVANDRNANFYRGYVMSRRLNRAEYRNTIRDLFGVAVPVDDLLPEDAGGGEGFDTSGNALFTSTIHIENYLAAAERILVTILPDKTRGLSPELKKSRAELLMGEESPSKAVARGHARRIVSRLAALAYRRPVEIDEVERAMTMFDRAVARGDAFVPSVRLALQSVLISPNFLFLVEPEPEQKGIQPLPGAPLASKLSYFIWSSLPDKQLMDAALSGKLSDTNVIKAEVRRMLADPKAEALGERFALQWLEIERLGEEVKPDPKKFPEFDHALHESMRREVSAMFNYVFRNNRPVTELIDTDYTFVNERLAKIYGLENVKGDEFRKVSFTTKDRGGVTGMAAVHALTSYPLRTSPVLRGRWILEALLGEKVPPPPPDVPALEETKAEGKTLTLREQLQMHREKPDCAGCHNKMDPLGFGLENFDNLGRWRAMIGDQPVDASGELPGGQKFQGHQGLKNLLMARKDHVVKHMAKKMTGYAFGRELNKFDDCVVDNAVAAMQKNEYRAAIMIEEIATSFPFRHRFYPKQEKVESER